jgi:hypothetical protein
MRSTLAAGTILLLALVFPGLAAAQEFPKPGPEHELLKQMAGDWDAEVTASFVPGAPAETSKAAQSNKMDVGGYFLVTEFKGKMGGVDFQGRGTTGYDPFKKKYTGVWVDSMGPALYHIEGAFDKAGKVYTESMQGPDPMGNPIKFRSVTEITDKDQMNMKMFVLQPDGKENKMLDIKLTRKK